MRACKNVVCWFGGSSLCYGRKLPY